jgi:uncharacterized integral membrane protein (TIGR00698 family)
MATPIAPVPSEELDPYAKYRFLDSYEGLPDPDSIHPAEPEAERREWRAWQRRGHAGFARLGRDLPGVVVAAALAWSGGLAAESFGTRVLGYERSPIGAVTAAIVLGLAIRNAIGLPAVYEAGLQLCARRVLRIGVALLGFRLSLGAVGAIGLAALPVVAGCIVAALVLVSLVARALALPSRLGTLVAAGTAICGNTAVVAVGTAIRADDDEISYAVGCVTLFGLLALLTYPHLAHALFAGDPKLAGMFLGTAIHDTAQVAGAGMVYAEQYASALALDTATVTKLVRNLFLVVVVPGLAVLHGRSAGAGRVQLRSAIPLFVAGFVALSLLRTLGDLGERPFGVLPRDAWQALEHGLSLAANACLAVAMAAVGLGTSLARLRSLGLRPLVAGLSAALCVGAVSWALLEALS